MGYTQRLADWKLILENCVSIQEKASKSTIILDEQIFASRRYGFDPKQAQFGAKEVETVVLMQRTVRKWLKKRRE